MKIYNGMIGIAFGLFATKKLKDEGVFKQYPDVRNFTAGGMAGFVAGNVVGPTEALKVKLQTTTNYRGAINIIRNDWKGLLRTAPPFGAVFSGVCALEFSIVDNVSHQYGAIQGIIASAITGAFFLTAADHLMFRMDKGKSLNKAMSELYAGKRRTLWTGFTPMLFREAISIINVMMIGPKLGKVMQNLNQSNQNTSSDDLFWRSVGRYQATLMGAFVSHPFDYMARELQMRLLNNPDQKPKIRDVIQKTPMKVYWKGIGPRMVVAPVGLTLAGSGFDFFHKKLEQSKEDKIAKSAEKEHTHDPYAYIRCPYVPI